MRRNRGGSVILIGVIAVLAVVAVGIFGSYNGLVGLHETVSTQSSNIDAQLQRRADLIPNLVNTVKGYASHETEVMKQIADARGRLAGAGTMREKAGADAELTGALNRLMMVVENYPDLKADAQYTALMDELAGTENRIAVARRDYNEAAQAYNQKVRSFPTVFIAPVFGFQPAEYFEASQQAQSAPAVDLG